MRVVGSPTKSGLWTIGLVRSAHASYDRRQSSAASLPPTRSVATLKRCWDSRAPADKPGCRSGRPARRARQPFGSHFLYPISRGPPRKPRTPCRILLRRMSAIEEFTGNRSEFSSPFAYSSRIGFLLGYERDIVYRFHATTSVWEKQKNASLSRHQDRQAAAIACKSEWVANPYSKTFPLKFDASIASA